MSVLTEFLTDQGIEYRLNVSLKELSSFKIGGNAEIICYPKSANKTSLLIKFCNERNIKYLPFGKCSNVLFPESGIKSLIIKTDKMNSTGFENGLFSFGSGVMLAKASKYTIDNGYKGMEFAYGIPGSVGGAVYMNAGAYGGEMSQCVEKTEYVDSTGNICVLEKDKHDFSYRHSFFSDGRYVITKTFVKLEKGDVDSSLQLVEQLQNLRKTKQPLDMPSAGSVFKRPEGYYAGKLIEDCGLKGYKVGGAMVSTKHCGFIVNFNNAKSEDVKKLISVIKDTVLEKYGVKLECELKFIED